MGSSLNGLASYLQIRTSTACIHTSDCGRPRVRSSIAYTFSFEWITFIIYIQCHVKGETHEIRKYSICMHKGRRYARYSQDGIFHPGETNNIKGYLYAIKPNYFKIFSSSGIKFLLNNLDDHVGCLQRQ